MFEQVTSGLSCRLQSENPFDKFKKAYEKAAEKKAKTIRTFESDQAFFTEEEDEGMCLSMHQPWASLLIHGFKRYEGREWTHEW